MKLTIKLGALSASNILLSFLIQWFILMSIGVGETTDAFFAGMTIPQLMIAVISNSLMHVLVPLLSGEQQQKLRTDTWTFLVLITSLFSCLALILYCTAFLWIPLIVPGFSESAQSLTITLTKIQIIGMVFSAINGVQWAAYHAQKKFIWAEFVPILTSLLGFILLFWALPRYGIIAAAWIASLRLGLQTLLLAPGLGRPVRPNFQSISVMQAWHRIKPLLLGATYYKTDNIINRFLLSSATGGSLSLYNLATQIYEAIGYVFNKAIIAPLVPALSAVYKADDLKVFKKILYRKLIQTVVLGVLAYAVLIFVGQGLLELLLGYGYINKTNLIDLWWIMVWLAGLLIGGIGAMLATNAFYALGNTTTPTKLNVVTYSIQIPIKILVFGNFGIQGLAISTSIYHISNFCILLILLIRTLKNNLSIKQV